MTTATTTIPMRTQRGAIAVLKEMEDFYGENPLERRAMKSDGICAYQMVGGCQCSIGRKLPLNSGEIR